MGYTHYWTFRRPAKGEAKATEKKYQAALKECSRFVLKYQSEALGDARLSGFTAHTPIGTYGGLKVNGKGENAHEDFYMREHFKQNLEQASSASFCKTAQKPYDIVVTACLTILKAHLGDLIEVHSDGDKDDWKPCRALILLYLRKVYAIPNTIRQPKAAERRQA
jgi:hypothetical protein